MAKPRIVRINETFQPHCGDEAEHGGVRNEEKWKKGRRRSAGEDTRKKIKIKTSEDVDGEKVKSTKRQIRNLNETERELCKINFALISFYISRAEEQMGDVKWD